MLKRVIPLVLIIIGIIGYSFLITVPRATAMKLVQEGGVIEDGTAILFFIGVGICLWRYLQIRKAGLFWLEFAVIFCAMGLRELDPHRIIKGFNYFNLDFYVNPYIHLGFKLLFAILMFCLFGTLFHFFLTNLPLFIHSLKRCQTWAFTALGFIIAIFIASAHHKLVHFVLLSFFDIAQKDLGFFVRALEEPFELIAAFLFCLVAIQIPHEFLIKKTSKLKSI